ncbi:hypothetical protein BU14_0943s0001 [Porphyra umbilicalis]|uniref:Uncharacterized protein n=1 Tax=Porphyra umbilicalis TaxID=2786 RepID=A0A1X6NN84_PORUM|nr:hypothetical protein BU14_0943s0001 [Porphyra umbilicalis]|eukprot:OSX70032.1 hypothetical protein BU14_0943s0001 [Porphyra umbilicalis]
MRGCTAMRVARPDVATFGDVRSLRGACGPSSRRGSACEPATDRGSVWGGVADRSARRETSPSEEGCGRAVDRGPR